jgi:hypothetical protein
LSARAKHEYKELTVAAIQNKGVPTHLRSLIAGDYDQAVDFQIAAVRSFASRRSGTKTLSSAATSRALG